MTENNKETPVTPGYQELAEKLTKSYEEVTKKVIKEHDKEQGNITDKIAKVIQEHHKNAEDERNKTERSSTLKRNIFFIIIILLQLFAIIYIVKEKNRVNEETKHHLNSILNTMDEASVKNKIYRDVKTVIDSHRKHVLLYNKSKWTEDYTKFQIDKIAIKIMEAWQSKKIPPEKTMAFISSESLWIQNSKSDDGALGIMQVLPTTFWESIKHNWYLRQLDINNPADNIEGGTIFLEWIELQGNLFIKNRYPRKKGGWTITEDAIAWNGGPVYCFKYLTKKKNKLKPKLYEETEKFVVKVNFYYSNYLKRKYDVVWLDIPKEKNIETLLQYNERINNGDKIKTGKKDTKSKNKITMRTEY